MGVDVGTAPGAGWRGLTGLVTLVAAAGSGFLVVAMLLGPIAGPVAAFVLIALVTPLAAAHARLGVYPMTARGVGLLLIDHTWSLLNTLAAALFVDLHLIAGHTFARHRSAGSGRVHIVEGPSPRWVMAIGHVVFGGNPRTDRHEAVHVAQARWFGPLYLPAVALNWVLFVVVPVWWLYHDHSAAPIRGVRRYLECGVYPHLWNEVYAYRVQGTPPR